MEKIYEIGIWWFNVVGVVDNFEFGRYGVKIDDNFLDVFVRVFSVGEQSRVLFVEWFKMFVVVGDKLDFSYMVGRKFF